MAEMNRCPECNGAVRPRRRRGRTWEYYRGVRLEIPERVVIPECEECGALRTTAELEGEIERALKPAAEAWLSNRASHLVSALMAQQNAPARQVAGVCGVTATYLSHVRGGKKAPSLTLVRLLEALYVCPAEYRRHVEGQLLEPLLGAKVHPRDAYSQNPSAREEVRPKSGEYLIAAGSAGCGYAQEAELTG